MLRNLQPFKIPCQDLHPYGNAASPGVPQHTSTTTASNPNMTPNSYAATNRDGSNFQVGQRIDTDPSMAQAWQNESSVRHVGNSEVVVPPYAKEGQPRSSSESHGSPSRSSMRGHNWDKGRIVREAGMA